MQVLQPTADVEVRGSSLSSPKYLIDLHCRPASIGELYAYLPLTSENSERLSAVPPKSTVNADYGISVGRGAFKLQKAVGGWVTFAFRVKLNDVQDNGIVLDNGV